MTGRVGIVIANAITEMFWPEYVILHRDEVFLAMVDNANTSDSVVTLFVQGKTLHCKQRILYAYYTHGYFDWLEDRNRRVP